MRVLHINSYFNGCSFYRHLFDAQSALGLDVRAFVPMPVGDAGATAAYYGPYTDVSCDHGKYDRLIFQIKHAKILRDAMARYGGGGFDVIHAHSLFSNGYIAMKLSASLGIPYIVAVRDTDINTFFAKMPHLRPLGRRILQGASRVIFLSTGYRDRALEPYLPLGLFEEVLEKSAVIPNGIDPFWHEHAGAAHRLNDGALRLLCVGRASKRKNVLTAVRAAEALQSRGEAVSLDVVIGVVEDEGILRQIEQSPLVTLHRNLTREQLLPMYRAADIFVLPSLTETFGLVYAEAMSQGLPVIYTRGQGFDGQFPDGEAGYAVDPMDANGIADAILRIRGDYEAISARCAKLAAQYDWNAYAAEYRRIYTEVTAR